MKRLVTLAVILWIVHCSTASSAPVITFCPPVIKAFLCDEASVQLTATPAPGCEQLSWSVSALGTPPAGTVTIDGTGVLRYAFVNADGGQLFNFRVIVTDDCSEADSCLISAEVISSAPFVFRISKPPMTLLGREVEFAVTKEEGSASFSSFDFLISYHACVLNLLDASLGSALGSSGCDWDYFTYNIVSSDFYDGLCQVGLVRLRAYADLNNGGSGPLCYHAFNSDTLATVRFYVTHNYWHECEFSPVRFAWQTCGDNTLQAHDFNARYGACHVFDYANTDPIFDPNYELTDTDCGQPLRLGGDCDACDSAGSPVVGFAYFWNGGVELQCLDPVCIRGDINLNRLAYEVGDLVLFRDYFLYGLSVLFPNPDARLCAADIDGNGQAAGLPDLVMMFRVFAGDTLAIPPAKAMAGSAEVSFANGILTVDSPEEISAIFAKFSSSDISTEITDFCDLELHQAVADDGTLRVLLLPPLDNVSADVAAGAHSLLSLSGHAELVEIQITDDHGRLIETRLRHSALPDKFTLSQNVPNPFNPTTTIGLYLPTESDWILDIINVAGQVVKTFSGRNSGAVSIAWDAHGYPSGVYFYRASAGAQTQTRKMVVLK